MQNCPLGVCAMPFTVSVRFRCFFPNLPIFPNKFRVFFWSECVSPKQKNGGKYCGGHFVIFSVQNARGGFADIVLLRGGQGGVLRRTCASATRPCPQEKRPLLLFQTHYFLCFSIIIQNDVNSLFWCFIQSLAQNVKIPYYSSNFRIA